MIYRLTFSMLLAVLLPACLWAQSKPYTIQGKLGLTSKPTKAYLFYMDPVDQSQKIDSVSVTNGQFAFKGTVPLHCHARLYTARNFNSDTGFVPAMPPSISLYIEPGTIRVISPDSLNNAMVQGGPLNADYSQLRTLLKPVERKEKELMAAYMALPPEKRDDKETEADFDKRSDAIQAEQTLICKQFIKQKPNSQVSVWAVKSAGGYKPDLAVVRPLFNSLSANVRNSPAGKSYAQELATMERVAVGSAAPDFTQPDTLGKAVSLRDFKGQYVLLDFWGSGCLPCRKENPNLVKLFNQYKTRNFTILGVGIDQQKSAWMEAIHKDGLPWVQVSDLKFWNNDVVKLYSIRLIPQNLLISPDGIILAKNLYGADLDKKLAEILPPTP